jgi:predicted nucleic acid-binding protein
MIILREQVEEQSLKFIPRQYKATTIVLVNEMTNETTTISSDFYKDSYYLYTTTTFDLKEGNFYTLTIKNNTDVVYKDKIFCTNQVIADYTINDGEYVANQTTNDFIVYE